MALNSYISRIPEIPIFPAYFPMIPIITTLPILKYGKCWNYRKMGNIGIARFIGNIGSAVIIGKSEISEVPELSENRKYRNCRKYRKIGNIGTVRIIGKSDLPELSEILSELPEFPDFWIMVFELSMHLENDLLLGAWSELKK